MKATLIWSDLWWCSCRQPPALCEGNVVSCLTAMCALSRTLAALEFHSRVILSAICVVYLFASWFVCCADTCVTDVDFRVQPVPWIRSCLGGLHGCAPKAVTSASKPGLEPEVEITRQWCPPILCCIQRPKAILSICTFGALASNPLFPPCDPSSQSLVFLRAGVSWFVFMTHEQFNQRLNLAFKIV